ncbi:MAG: methyltransferase domain-containing protein [Thermaerobacterales bacterium]
MTEDATPSRCAWDAHAGDWLEYSATASGQRRAATFWGHLTPHLDALSDGSAGVHGRRLQVLDAGCGSGELGLRLVAAGHRCSFIDLSPQLLASVRQAAARMGADALAYCTFYTADLTEIGGLFGPGSVDVIILHSVIEFVPDPPAVLQELTALLAPWGLLSVAVSNTWGQVLKAALEEGDAEKARQALLGDLPLCSRPFGIEGRSYTPAEITAVLEQAGLYCEALYGGQITADYILGRHGHSGPDQAGDWADLELALGRQAPFSHIGRMIQVIARRAPSQ